MLHTVAELYSVAHTFNSRDIFQWQSTLEKKYAAIPCITSLHDFIVTKDTVMSKATCYTGNYDTITLWCL